MPAVLPISDLQRNTSAIASRCHETGEPIYLTKNGKASLVVMDAAEFDARFAALGKLQEHEERVRRAISRGYDDMLNGRVRSLAQAKQDIERIRAARYGA